MPGSNNPQNFLRSPNFLLDRSYRRTEKRFSHNFSVWPLVHQARLAPVQAFFAVNFLPHQIFFTVIQPLQGWHAPSLFRRGGVFLVFFLPTWSVRSLLAAIRGPRIRGAIHGRISRCHRGDPGSIPGRRIHFRFIFLSSTHSRSAYLGPLVDQPAAAPPPPAPSDLVHDVVGKDGKVYRGRSASPAAHGSVLLASLQQHRMTGQWLLGRGFTFRLLSLLSGSDDGVAAACAEPQEEAASSNNNMSRQQQQPQQPGGATPLPDRLQQQQVMQAIQQQVQMQMQYSQQPGSAMTDGTGATPEGWVQLPEGGLAGPAETSPGPAAPAVTDSPQRLAGCWWCWWAGGLAVCLCPWWGCLGWGLGATPVSLRPRVAIPDELIRPSRLCPCPPMPPALATLGTLGLGPESHALLVLAWAV
ncbi:hypothetical protein PAPYR_6223 [Paratrimastix pyriformis]|uniref:Uncharacterized protein n=1 Tax=Paratrimastix pyriformis TaxID=342808 RepID=A0ABQ8UFQ2_9EUKA|nr:hypothetical protein PAPYR_6223 [Paratrimastix pyriformis]